ncbi:MAG: BNR-repeat neuraminidase N-terminal domain-containing protein [Bacteroidota bacterium]
MKKSLWTIKEVCRTVLVLGVLFLVHHQTIAQVSVTATAGTTGPTAYTTLSSAFSAINAGTHQGDITVDISSSFVDPATSLLNSSGSGSALYTTVLVRPVNDGLIVGYTGVQGRGVIELNGADSVTIDGDNPFTAGINRNLTLTNAATATTTFTSVIRVATDVAAPYTDANGIVIKNVIINGSAAGRNLAGVTSAAGSENTTFGIMAGPNGGATVTAISSVTAGMATGATVNNFTVTNCSIISCARGIAFVGSSALSSSGVTVTNNVIGDQAITLSGVPPFTSPSTTVYTKGIVLQGVNAVNVSNNTIKNVISYVSTPISAIELTANIGTGTINIANNSITSIIQNASTSNAPRGIYLLNSAGAYTISNNIISHVEGNCPSSTLQPTGIHVVTAAPSATIERNVVKKVYNRNNQSYGVTGILMAGGSNILFKNNMVSDVLQDMSVGSFGTTYPIAGIKISSGTGHKVYHNTVHLSGITLGAGAAANQTSNFAFCLTSTTLTGCDVRNNIFSNMISGGNNTSAHTSIFLPTGGTIAMNLTLNNNAYFCGTNDSMQGIAQVGTTTAGFYKQANFNSIAVTPGTNLRAYTRLLSAAGDNDSVSMAFSTAAPFTSASDLHIPAGTTTPLESTGATTTVLTDVDGHARPGPVGSINGGALAPDIGADEGDFIPVNFVFDSSNVDQIITSVLQGTPNQTVLRIRVYTSGYLNPKTLTSLKLNTSGSTNPIDITNAAIYYTGSSSTFTTTTTFGSPVTAPNGTFNVTGSQVLSKGVNYFWLTYDVSASAGLLNVLDGRLDSLLISGVRYAPINGNPAGNVLITNPMTYLSSTTTQNNINKVGQGSVNNQIIGIRVVTSATGTPINLTNFDLNVTGTTDTSNIRNMKIWYTGNTNSFATTTQFGTTLSYLPGSLNFSVAGNQALTNGTNYFWLTYDINPLATVGNVVDAECVSTTINTATYVPTVTAPSGSRQIRVEYCPPTYSFSCSNGDFVNNFSTTGATNNVSVLGSGCNNTGNSYNYYQSQTITASKATSFVIHYQGSGAWPEGFKIWIDYNQDGVFDVSEMVASAAASLIMNHSTVTIPCTALAGTTRLRIRDVYNGIPGTACSTEAYGEAEDYDIEIVENPLVYQSSTAIQQTGSVAAGNMDKPVLRVPVVVTGCGTALATTFVFNTASSTSAPADIVSAKLYSTGNSPIFNTNKLVGTVGSPNGSMVFTASDTLLNNDTTNYWLVYDINGSAVTAHIVDARLDSIQLMGTYRIPTVGNPSGSLVVSLPMTYVNTVLSQSVISKVAQGSSNNQVLKVEVITSASGAPVNLTQLDFNVTGTTDTSNIRNMKVWYSGGVNTFSTATQFGTTLAYLPGTLTFSITGVQSLNTGSNYFWLTYDISATAATGNTIDGECASVTVAGVPQTLTPGAITGSRQIRFQYCTPTQTGTTLIKNVTFNALHNTPATPVTPFYRTFAAVDSTTTTVGTSLTYNLSVTTAAAGSISVWIDYNDDGLFSASEWNQVTTSSTANVASVTPVTIPCSATIGELRMRIRSRSTVPNGGGDACTAFAAGETQDYTITTVNTPVSYSSSTAIQRTGNVVPGSNDNAVLRIPIRINGCGLGSITSVNVNTVGSTSATDIVSAKLYATGNSTVFSTTKQLGSTVFSPSGAFVFTLTDTLLNNDTTNLWLAYDINPGAVFGHVLDARLDSIQINGVYRIPTVGAPAGSLLIDGPMTYLSSSITQSATSKIGQGTSDNHILGIQVVTSAAGSVVNLSQFDFNTNGTTDTSNIRNIKVWYTGASNLFATTTQVGSTLAYLPGSTSFSIIGSQALANGNNYFWLTYDISATATSGNVVDAECLSMIVGGLTQIPTITAPAGSQQIRANYCVPPFTTGCVDGDFVNNFATVGGITNISNLLTGCNPNTNSYIYYPSQTLTVRKGSSLTINYRGSGNWPEGHRVWIDFDQDGVFSPNEEVAGNTPSAAAQTATVVVPLTTLEGTTRMRIRNVYNAQPATSCSSETWGETEDYNVLILPAPAPTTYTWNKTAPDSFNLAANWTPVRTFPNQNDILKFDGGGSVTVLNTMNAIAGQLFVTNNTTVTLSAPSLTTFVVLDSLKLTSGQINTGANVTLSLGKDTVSTGVLTGTGTIQGTFRRWISSTTLASYTFPLAVGTTNRTAIVDYTVIPANAGTLTAMFVSGPTTNGGLPLTQGAITINKIATTGYWSFAATNGLSGGAYTATITAASFIGVVNHTSLVLVKRISTALPWSIPGTHVTTTGSTAIPVLSRIALSDFGDFGIGGDSNVNPLPITLISFNAQKKSDDVLLNWTTTNELNNTGFAIERMSNKNDWKEIGWVDGSGSAMTINKYEFTDELPFVSNPVTLYYRLKQVDLDGTITYSKMISVSPENTDEVSIVQYPNPFTKEFSLIVQSDADGIMQTEIYDQSGKMVWHKELIVAKGSNLLKVTETAELKPGVYFIKVLLGDQVFNLKLSKLE